ncbi:hypothetical protein H4219_001283 [Mycoemilia scoparia]|uniref:DH domain-containing protein n=1 Tax=Mycoemilia scoparia TaxID=417184 RepID=A0A9W8DQI5_9FUNG|nr:hypothetical protein H4219_001283 [Mycoemilia scoparia]
MTDAPLVFSSTVFSRSVPRRKNGLGVVVKTPDASSRMSSNSAALGYFAGYSNRQQQPSSTRPPTPNQTPMIPINKSVSTPTTPPNEAPYPSTINKQQQAVLHLGPQHLSKISVPSNTGQGFSSTKLRRKGRSHNRSRSMVPLEFMEDVAATMMPSDPPPQLPATTVTAMTERYGYQIRTPSSLSLASINRQSPRVPTVQQRNPLTPHSPTASTSSSIYSVESSVFQYHIPVQPQTIGRQTLRRGRSASQLHDEGKRWRIIQELIDTERTFVNDIRLALDIYWNHVPENVRSVVFGNLSDLAAISTRFLHQLQARSDAAAEVMMEMADDIERVFTEYCANYEHAAMTVQSLDLSSRDKILVGRTNSWDLASLLVKPVQRVLKYPLLFRELALVSSGNEGMVVHRAKQRVDLIAERVNGKDRADPPSSSYNRHSTATTASSSGAEGLVAAVQKMVNNMHSLACAWEDMYRPIDCGEQLETNQLLNQPYSVLARERCFIRANNWRKIVEMIRDELVPLLVEKQRLDKLFSTIHSIIREFGVNVKSDSGQKEALKTIDQSIENVYFDNLPLNRLRWSSFWTETDQFFQS